MKKELNFLFIVQGEGRGHISQAITLKQIIEEGGHRVGKVFIGTYEQREPPTYIKDEFDCEVETFDSPGFLRSKNLRGIKLSSTIIQNLLKSGKYIRSINSLKNEIDRSEYNIVVNFYDMIGGMAYRKSLRKIPCFIISHHFLFEQPGFPEPPNFFIQKKLLNIHNTITAKGARKRIALSFSAYENFNNTIVLPPLVRQDINNVPSEDKGFVLVYLLNEGLVVDLLPVFKENSKIIFRIFSSAEVFRSILPGNVILEKPSFRDFGKALKECSAIICTAGFETTCEANFLGKPVFLIPSDKHYEQHGNLMDAIRNGMGEDYRDFDQQKLKPRSNKNFKDWCVKAPKMFLDALCE